MKRFWEIIKEDAPIGGGGGMPPPPPPSGGMGGGMPPMPPGGGMGMGGPPIGGPPGLGGPPLGGGGGAPSGPVAAPEQLVPLTVWQVLTKILENKPIKNQPGQGGKDMVKNAQLPQPSAPEQPSMDQAGPPPAL